MDGDSTPVLVDILELVPLSEGQAKTTAYAPKEGVGSQERDRYAVLAIVDEMVRASKLDEPVRQRISAAISLCREHHPPLAAADRNASGYVGPAAERGGTCPGEGHRGSVRRARRG